MFRKLSTAVKPPNSPAPPSPSPSPTVSIKRLDSTTTSTADPKLNDFIIKAGSKLPPVLSPQDKLEFLSCAAPYVAAARDSNDSKLAGENKEDPEWFNFDFAQYLLGVHLGVFTDSSDQTIRVYPDELQPVFWTENQLGYRLSTLLCSMDLPFRSYPHYQVFCSLTQPILTEKKEKVAVVAIDFGSTHSGFAFALLKPPQTVVLSKLEKEPTAALFERETMKLVFFGDEARDFFMRSLAGDLLLNKFSKNGNISFSKDRYLYFDGGDLKMRLWDNANGNEREEDIQARTCRTMGGTEKANLLDVVSKILKQIRDDALDAVSSALVVRSSQQEISSPMMGHNTRETRKKSSSNSLSTPSSPLAKTKVNPDEILWVITVPAIWREADKQFMRRACFNAQIVSEPFAADLVLALEPECAALASKFVDVPALRLTPGEKLLVFDCGGGTCDVCAMEVLNNSTKFSCKLLLVPSGGNWGGTKIDDLFFKFIEDLFGSAIINRCAQMNPACLIELQDQWEKLKQSLQLEDFLDESGEMKRSLDANYLLREANSAMSLSQLCKQFNAKQHDKSQFVSAKSEALLSEATILKIPAKLLRTFFDDVFDSIVNHASHLIMTFPSALQGLEQILLVGGVGSSPYLKLKFSRKFPKMKIFQTTNAASSTSLVAYGAVKFGLQPSVISSRRARMTLGVKTTIEYNSQLHRGKLYRENKFFDRAAKKHYIRNVFKPFLVAGEEVESEKVVIHKFQPSSMEVTRVKFDVYTCDERPPVQFVNEEGCRLLARIFVPVEKGEMPLLEVKLRIGFTEISAEVCNAETDQVVMKRVLFEFHPSSASSTSTYSSDEELRYERSSSFVHEED